jgi:hypothetical protein
MRFGIDRIPGKRKAPFPGLSGARNETRTRDPHLGKVMLYQLSYSRFYNDLSINVGAKLTNMCSKINTDLLIF